MTRRSFLAEAGLGIGSLGLFAVAGRGAETAPLISTAHPLAPKPPHYAPKAKNIIYLFMSGGPSQLDLFDPKETLSRLDGRPCPASLLEGERFAFIKGVPKLLGSPFTFKQYGQSGAVLSNLLPRTAGVADDIAIVRSLHTDPINHGPAQIFINTGHSVIGRPSIGSWILHGLGSENANLPGYVVLLSGKPDPGAGNACWSSGFLPSEYQGVDFRPKGDPVLSVSNPAGVAPEVRRRSLDTLRALNEKHLREVGDPEIASRIAAYETSFRMQTSVPELADIASEPDSVHEMYGTKPGENAFANNCLLARRMVERGVRFVQLFHSGWDHHGTRVNNSINVDLPKLCAQTDRASAALVKDLKQRGLLDETLVIWGGEFGRTPMREGEITDSLGRDHHIRAFTMWLAGGGIRPGITVGQTDEIGYHIEEDPVHVHDLNATILHLMGLDHEKLTYLFQGRDHRLTDVHGEVVQKLLA